MPTQRHLFVMDPFSALNLKLDSSLRMAYSLKAQGAKVFFTTLNRLQLNSFSSHGQAQCAEISYAEGPESASLGDFETFGFESFSGIHMRKDPPFDLNYIAATWILDKKPETTKIINHPQALRDINEKLALFLIQDFSDKIFVGSCPEAILKFIEEHCANKAIIKPLDLYGGKGVKKFFLGDFESLDDAKTALNEETEQGKNTRLIQPFNESIYEGEIRAFTAGGEEISYCLKVPSAGSYLANTGSGAALKEYKPSKDVSKMVIAASQYFMSRGVFLVGYDIIGDFISEVNITSPRLLLPDSVDSNPYYDKVAKLMIEYCK